MKKINKKEIIQNLKNIKNYSSDTIEVYEGIKNMCISKLTVKNEKKFEEYKRDNLILLRRSKIIENKIKNNSNLKTNITDYSDIMKLWKQYNRKFFLIEKKIYNILNNNKGPEHF